MLRVLAPVIFLSITAFFFGCSTTPESGERSALSQALGEDDWSLPPSVQLSSDAGIYPDILAISWKQLNPAEGVFDMRMLDSALILAAQQRIDFFVVPYLADRDFVPEWVIQKYRLAAYRFPFNPTYQTQIGPISQGYFVPIWNEGYQQELRFFLRTLAQHRIFQSPRFKFMYFPGAWRWGEFTVEFTHQMKEDGLTPQLYIASIQRLIDLFTTAFQGKEHTLVWTGYDNLEYCDQETIWRDYIGRQISHYALSKGVGARHGGIERFNWALSDIPNWGTSLDTIGGKIYMRTNESVPLLADHRRIFGAEAECFGTCEGGGLEKTLGTYYHKKMTMLKALQLRMRWIDVDKDFAREYPSLYEYVRKSVGKSVTTSPDCWVALRGAHDDAYPHENVGANKFLVHNWERWLYQRDIEPNGSTVLADMTPDAWQKLAEPVYESRQTYHAQKQDYIYFDVDDRFAQQHNGGAHTLKVTYLDNFVGSWYVEYSTDSTPYKKSFPVRNQNDGQWKTVSLLLPDVHFLNKQQGGMDFRIYNGGTNDIRVRFVRLLGYS